LSGARARDIGKNLNPAAETPYFGPVVGAPARDQPTGGTPPRVARREVRPASSPRPARTAIRAASVRLDTPKLVHDVRDVDGRGLLADIQRVADLAVRAVDQHGEDLLLAT
jgi:hypothetical protein